MCRACRSEKERRKTHHNDFLLKGEQKPHHNGFCIERKVMGCMYDMTRKPHHYGPNVIVV